MKNKLYPRKNKIKLDRVKVEAYKVKTKHQHTKKLLIIGIALTLLCFLIILMLD